MAAERIITRVLQGNDVLNSCGEVTRIGGNDECSCRAI